MGLCLAEEAAMRGADVILVAGRMGLKSNNSNIRRIDVVTAEEMYNASMQHFNDADIAILAAAVADFTPITVSNSKIKKEDVKSNNGRFVIELIKTKDILANMGSVKKSNQTLVGFALETNNVLENAKKKLISKNADFIVLNNATEEGAGFGVLTNRIAILSKFGTVVDFTMKPKRDVAKDILDYINL